MSAKGRPPLPEHGMYRLWELLNDAERRVLVSLGGNLIASEPLPRRVKLESLRAIDRLMRLPPGRLEQLPEALIAITEEEDE